MDFRALISKLPSRRRLRKEIRFLLGLTRRSTSLFLRFAVPGHYYSRIPDLEDVMTRREALFGWRERHCSGVPLSDAPQLKLLDSFPTNTPSCSTSTPTWLRFTAPSSRPSHP